MRTSSTHSCQSTNERTLTDCHRRRDEEAGKMDRGLTGKYRHIAEGRDWLGVSALLPGPAVG